MKARHTPGPWFSSELRTQGADPSKDGCDIGASNGANIAIALHQESDRKQQETVANARLLAAAPELLAALQNIRTSHTTKHNEVEAWRWADSTIAKATGATA